MQTLPSWSPLWPLGSTPHPLCTTLAPRWVFTGPNSRFTAEHTALPLKLPKAQQSAPLPCPSLLPPTGACQGLPCSPPTSVFLCGFSTIIISHKPLSLFKTVLRYGWFTVLRSFLCPAELLSHAYMHPSSVLFHCGLSQDVEYGSLCCTPGPCCLSSCRWVCICSSQTHSPRLPPAPAPPWQTQICSLGLWVCSVL